GGTVINAGLIEATNISASSYGVELGSGAGEIINQAGGTITAYARAIQTNGPATIVNAGTIKATATNGIAVLFGGGANNLLVDMPGAVFIGSVVGSGYFPGPNVLELAAAASVGVIGGFGSQYSGFTGITIDAGASWNLTGANTIVGSETLINAGTLKLLGASLLENGGLVNDGLINIDPSTLVAGDISGTGTFDIGADSTLTIGGTVSAGETFVFTGTAAVLNILQSSHFAGTITAAGPTDTVNLACFAAGTRLSTLRGDIAVETVRVGERMPVRFAQDAQEVIWVGRRHIDCRRHRDPRLVWPVRIAANTFGPRRPCRDLFLSPDHAVFIRDVLVPVRHLMNNTSIAQVPLDAVTYYHIELPQHDVLWAEGLPVESYLDVGERSGFSNGGGPIALHPDFATRQWEAFGCAPLVVVGAELDDMRRMLDHAASAAA
ncbi:MAG TPA: Hint domain-containing protein, partial [Rhodopila sp.]